MGRRVRYCWPIHARQVRTHLTQLSAKGYASHVHPSPDFVVMFLPGEMFFSAGARAGSIAHRSWRRARAARDPREPDDADCAAAGGGVRGGSRNRWRRTRGRSATSGAVSTKPRAGSASVSRHSDCGWNGALDAYNSAVGSLEGNVLVKARKFKEYQAANGGEEITELEPIDRVPRMLQAAEARQGSPVQEWRHRRRGRSSTSLGLGV